MAEISGQGRGSRFESLIGSRAGPVRLVRYAGFDPAEDDLEGTEMAPLHEDDSPPGKTDIDLARAWELKRQGKTWGEVGKILAQECGRRSPYQGESVGRAANLFRARVR